MIKRFNRSNRKFESIEDPREVLLSLVDLGSADIEDVLLACVQTMSDREVKNVLNQFTLCSAEDEFDSEYSADEIDDAIIDSEAELVDSSDDSDLDEEDDEDEEDAEEEEVEECNSRTRLEDRINRLEKRLLLKAR